ncbi:MAG: hypothetical protein ABS85_10700 [Sphingobacteriales bacterium SCN 48-20]|uniref:hypothetical protein n=1 Tax=Terrimonas ferruginea TaxID=249 RepID=UPI00086B50D0|nr:hypothetical protein [Terrimonas ferruginea]MBN8782428.1 hypothetical protein [Terrimonas ferruginea]ODT92122.1 MAG: hypothetical protein ABS85_10700 [Sphingobacteriales bacterium SCN 48-20]OJW42940.1 MAG: hypothetical protein BGO56_12990 [Sphingobacteriales bacterium 48-107]
MPTVRFACLLLLCAAVTLFSCTKDVSNNNGGPRLVFVFHFDSTQARLNNVGQPSPMPAGHAGQHPKFNTMSAHYLELAPGPLTALGAGAVLYRAPETAVGGSNAIDFSKAAFAGQNQEFYSLPLSEVAPGSYEWLRLSLAYQNYDIKYYVDTVISGIPIQGEFGGTVASFIGFNTYISTYKIKQQQLQVNGNRRQGYWGFETVINVLGQNYPLSSSGEAPAGATTVVNPLFATSPVPAGSCVVTAAFAPGKLVITGNETNDVKVQVSLSVNKSFEWEDRIPDGKWQPGKQEAVVDMGIRGMVPKVL